MTRPEEKEEKEEVEEEEEEEGVRCERVSADHRSDSLPCSVSSPV